VFSRRIVGWRVSRSPRSDLALDALEQASGAAAWLGLAAPAAAHGIGPGSGRTGAIVAWSASLIGVIAGGIALARSSRQTGSGGGRDGAIVALALALVGMALAALHLVTSPGAIGTGNGRAGAILALVLGLIGIVLGRVALSRSRRSV
jgi:hypothetical protein